MFDCQHIETYISSMLSNLNCYCAYFAMLDGWNKVTVNNWNVTSWKCFKKVSLHLLTWNFVRSFIFWFWAFFLFFLFWQNFVKDNDYFFVDNCIQIVVIIKYLLKEISYIIYTKLWSNNFLYCLFRQIVILRNKEISKHVYYFSFFL